ncbi:unnamed protein product [Mesocestoides corti]|uniref:NADH dehydrogenase [ubiquinone] 1 alpha subcomplex subunit 12 n=1 Tax=Mesocestoides corti TaxID=53468 RepID=A0A0R3U108_MESCO|nr:unnamed protein product [Mesocestoides corti]
MWGPMRSSTLTLNPTRRMQTSAPLLANIFSDAWSKLKSSLAGTANQPHGTLVGMDELGNRYFEAEPDVNSKVPHRASKPMRYFLMPGQKTVQDSWMQIDTGRPEFCSPPGFGYNHDRCESLRYATSLAYGGRMDFTIREFNFLPVVELQRLPTEWDAWLRHSRRDPPTPEEIAGNRAAAKLRAQKGREIEVGPLLSSVHSSIIVWLRSKMLIC